MSLEGKTAIVTGASRGLGKAIAQRLALDGAAVGINYVQREDEAKSLVAEIRENGGRAASIQTDVSDVAQVHSMVEQIENQLGPVDILVNNAGVLKAGDIDDFDSADLEHMRRINVDGLVNTTKAVIEGMKRRRFGRIVNLTSIAAHGTSMPGTTFYAATKAAVSLLTRRFAMELGPYGITVNAIAPGLIVTDLVIADRDPEKLKTFLDSMAAKSMVRRIGRPEDVANAAGFLASPASGFVTAQILTVDGGRMDYITHP